ncbi:hypothetical protein TFKS16_1997 [Tannerella forsythia KS16]|nr:hypothetical protein TF3313_2041 [Tannerella forsythia 3313]BAR52212.1 hypothetical protein TFKS16_1997 [Tannerella forsythia KS16]
MPITLFFSSRYYFYEIKHIAKIENNTDEKNKKLTDCIF